MHTGKISFNTLRTGSFKLFKRPFPGFFFNNFNPLNAELNTICYLLALLAHHFLHVTRIRVKSLTLRLLMSYIYKIIIIIKPDIIIRDNEKRTCMVIDVAVSGDRNVIKKEAEKILKY